MRRVGSCLPTYLPTCLGRARSSKLSFGVRSKFWWAKIAATTTARLHCMYWLRRESMILGFSRQRSPPGRDGVGSTKYSTLHIPSDIVYICVCVWRIIPSSPKQHVDKMSTSMSRAACVLRAGVDETKRDKAAGLHIWVKER